MNIEAYNLDSLRRLVRSLQDENKRLKEQLDKAKDGVQQPHHRRGDRGRGIPVLYVQGLWGKGDPGRELGGGHGD